MCKQKAYAIWQQLGENERANAATTIAVVLCTDESYYCMSNDVSQISQAAINKAKEIGIKPTGNDYISQAGAGFHAEMWAVIQAMQDKDSKVNEIIVKIGASRACCKYCSSVLNLLKVGAEETSNDLYKSWYNPLTVNEQCKPRPDYQNNQYRHIPDFRNNSKDYWFTSADGKKYQDSPPNNAK